MKTVNFIEAVNSGKRFRPHSVDGYDWISTHDPNRSNSVRKFNWGDSDFSMSDLDFYNCQFELEEKEITITESQLDEVFAKTHLGGNFWKDFKKELGF